MQVSIIVKLSSDSLAGVSESNEAIADLVPRGAAKTDSRVCQESLSK